MDNPVLCVACGKQFLQLENSKAIDLGLVKGRTWRRIGLECPHCQTFYHGFFTNDLLDRRRKLIKKALEKYGSGSKEFIKRQERFKGYQSTVNQEGALLFDSD